jgi:inorganic pyrophosphatase
VEAFDAEEAMVLAAELFPERPRPSAAFLARPEHRGETDTMGLPPPSEESLMSDDVVDVVVEIPAGSRNKYEFDHEKNVFRLDRRLFTATRYPNDYGFVPDTLSLDGDPLDALVILDDPTFPGCWLRARVVGVFFMADEAGPDAKLLTVLENDPQRENIKELTDLPDHYLDEIGHFFAIYKDLEPGKSSDPGHFEGRESALIEIAQCRERFVKTPHA